MRVLLICSRFPWPPWRGNQVRTAQWAEALREHDLRLVCPGAPAGTISAHEVPVTPIRHSRSATGLGLLRAALDGRPLVIGRAADADVVVADPLVSRRHARLSPRSGRLVLADLGRTNGTLVNGQGITEAVVAPGDRLQLGSTRLEIVVPGEAGGR